MKKGPELFSLSPAAGAAGENNAAARRFYQSEVREIARKYGLNVSDKPDSQDFYTGDINDILQTEPKPGNFVNTAGKVLGTHRGIWNYTVGQRRGLGISADRPLYVIKLDKEKTKSSWDMKRSVIKKHWLPMV